MKKGKWFKKKGVSRPIVNERPQPKKKPDPLSRLNTVAPAIPILRDDTPINGDWMDAKEATKLIRSDPDMVFGVLYTEGEMDMKALEEECYREKWVPLFGLKHRTDDGEKPALLTFRDVGLAIDFIKVNLPDGWIPGLIKLPRHEVEHALEMGWDVKVVEENTVVKDDNPDYDVVSLIYEFVDKPTYHQRGPEGRKSLQ